MQAPGKTKAVVLFVHGHGAYLLHELLKILVGSFSLPIGFFFCSHGRLRFAIVDSQVPCLILTIHCPQNKPV